MVMDKFHSFPEVGMVYGDVSLIDDAGEITLDRCDREHGGRDFKGNELVRLRERNFICAPSVIARREGWLYAVPAPEYEFYYINQSLADYRVQDSNHHHKIVLKKSEEPSVFWLLGRIFNDPENSSELEEQKQRAKRSIYGAQYLDMADKYFGCHFNTDARRCYLQALRHKPAYLLSPGVTRRLLGTIIGRAFYESAKSNFKALVAPLLRIRS